MTIVHTKNDEVLRLVKRTEKAELNQQNGEVASSSGKKSEDKKPVTTDLNQPTSNQASEIEKKSVVEEQPLAGQPNIGEKESEEKSVPKPLVREAIDRINEYMDSLKRDLEFRFDEDSGRTIVKVIDKSTNEVVRVLPPEEAVSLADGLTAGGNEIGAIIDLKT